MLWRSKVEAMEAHKTAGNLHETFVLLYQLLDCHGLALYR